ncbi:MAG: phosphotransferase family protein [Alicyclobacillus sp.]|nr:phosphotransferase family protein [Alicyclobacillus sp.]
MTGTTPPPAWGPVRPGEAFDIGRLTTYLKQEAPHLLDGPIEVEQFLSGHSNLTYLIHTGAQTYVLRRPPLGPVAAKAHDMEREFRVLQAVSDVFALAPRPLWFCRDPSVIGAPFQLMERRSGLVVDRDWPPVYPSTPDAVRAVSVAPVETLVQLHQMDYRDTGLAAFTHPEGYLQRQVEGWVDRYERAKTEEIPEANALAARLVRDVPPSPPAVIVHNDLKLNNLLFDPAQPGCVSAVVDWEMATVGDPLTDLATTLCYWADPEDPPELRQWLGDLGGLPGRATRADLLERYALARGIDVSNFDYYLQFAYFKVAVICQQIYVRWRRGQTKDARFAALGPLARALMVHAHALVSGRV